MSTFELTKDNYFSREATMLYWGSSSFKAFDMENEGTEIFGNLIEGGCEAREMAVLKGEYEKEDKKAYIVGSYVHAWLEGPEAFQEYIDQNYSVLFKKNGSPYADTAAKGDAIIKILKKSELVTDIKTCDHEIIMTGQIAGIDFKIMVDLLDLERGYFADLKTTDKISKVSYKNGKKVSFIDLFDYKLQAALYAEIVRQNTGKNLDFYIIVADKKPTPDHEIIFLGNAKDDQFGFFAEKLDEIAIKIEHMDQVKKGNVKPQRCEKCAYCLSTKQLKAPITLDEFERKLGISYE